MFKQFLKRIVFEFNIARMNWMKLVFLAVYNLWIIMLPLKNLGLYLFVSREKVVIKDIGHYLLPEVYTIAVHDIPQSILWIIVLSFLVSFPIFPVFHKNKIYLIKGLILIIYFCAIVYSIRFVSVLITQMPDPSHPCRTNNIPRPKNVKGKNSLNIFHICFCMFQFVLMILNNFSEIFFKFFPHSCGDLMYSGHNATALFFWMIIAFVLKPVLGKKLKIALHTVFGILFVIQFFTSLIQRV